MATPTTESQLATTTPTNTPGGGDPPVSRAARSVSGISGYAAQAASLRPKARMATTAAKGAAQAADPRVVYTTYRTWIEARILELSALTGTVKLGRARGLLWQMEDVAVRLQSATVNIEGLSKTPAAGTAQDCGGVPPEWIEPARQIIEVLENEIEGVNATPAASRVEGSVYADEDWNSRLGVPQYRTQSDNLASPEATCNGTSFAMAIERLGVSRAAVASACETTMELTAESTPEQVEAKWKTKVGAFLSAENARGSNYQKLRGASQTATVRTTMAAEFKANAQMEDLVLFLAYLKGISRTSITSSSDNIVTLLGVIDGTSAGNLATVEKLTSVGKWDDTVTKVQTCLNGGGGVIFSLYHKGSKTGESGKTHIITVQRAMSDGFIVDDPYGRIRTDYSHKEYGDAFAAKGKMGRTTKNTKESAADDWKVAAAQDPTTAETRGRSYKLTKKSIVDSFYYMQLLSRPATL
jgi:hypothetical protein